MVPTVTGPMPGAAFFRKEDAVVPDLSSIAPGDLRNRKHYAPHLFPPDCPATDEIGSGC